MYDSLYYGTLADILPSCAARPCSWHTYCPDFVRRNFLSFPMISIIHTHTHILYRRYKIYIIHLTHAYKCISTLCDLALKCRVSDIIILHCRYSARSPQLYRDFLCRHFSHDVQIRVVRIPRYVITSARGGGGGGPKAPRAIKKTPGGGGGEGHNVEFTISTRTRCSRHRRGTKTKTN